MTAAKFGQSGYDPSGQETPVTAPQPDAEPSGKPSGKDELAKLIEEARGHLAAGVPQSAVDAVIRAVELLAGLV